jgi:von Willebrand factor type A domain
MISRSPVPEHFRFEDLAPVPTLNGATGQIASPIGLELSSVYTKSPREGHRLDDLHRRSGDRRRGQPSSVRYDEPHQDTLLVSDRASVVDFDGPARLAQALTSDKAALKAAIDTIDDSGSTDIGAGVRTGIDSLGAQGDPARVMVLLTDGDGSYSSGTATDCQTPTRGLGERSRSSPTRTETASLTASKSGTERTLWSGRHFNKMLKSLRDFAADAKCTGDGAGCSNFVRKASEQLAGLDP